MKLRRSLRNRIVWERLSSFLYAGTRITEVLSNARSGGSIAKMIAGATSILAVADLVGNSAQGGRAYWLNQGYKELPQSLGRATLPFLGHPEHVLKLSLTEREYWWNDGKIVAIYRGGRLEGGPFVADRSEYMIEVRKGLWGDSSSLILDSEKQQSSHDDTSPSVTDSAGYSLTKRRHQESRHIGKHPLSLETVKGKTVLLVGPSGTGKTLGICEQAERLHLRLLTITSDTVERMSVHELANIIDTIAPDVILLEDIQSVLQNNGADLLAQLEFLHGSTTVVCTLMDERTAFGPGDLCFPGIRPGRIDRVFFAELPAPNIRSALLLDGCPDVDVSILAEVVEATKGLSHAFIAELAKALNAPGCDWKAVVKEFSIMSPVRDGKGESILASA